MPRIPGVPTRRAGWLAKLLYRVARRRFGAVPEPATVYAHHNGVLLTWALFENTLQRAVRRLPEGLRELVTYRVATQVGCSWCVDFGTMLQRMQGLDIERLKEIDSYADSPRYTGIDKQAIAYADAMTAQPPTVTDEMVAALDAELGHDGLVELTFIVAVENMRARCFHALGITDQGFTSGEACRVPVPSDKAITMRRG
ncbi:transposase [Longimycelium tulufanense]|uniref:Transposase n=1 Tax=Longimycelium tulufanense TaxID=907463 RepID=A0A8J3FZA2_9PSEU|nr:carboxymuconolactone decarboxylase family protein [Longimycelium tulufanense]GGM82874.1 transposase [Longimycelium tulufanense]